MKTPEELGITRQQFNNLFKLAHYLLKGKLKAEFDMGRYSDISHRCGATLCGTVGCAIGHGPYAGIKNPECLNWDEYSLKSFGLAQYHEGAGHSLFSWRWMDVDNTPNGAAKRILYLLKYGKSLAVHTDSIKEYSGMRLVRKSHSKRKSK